MFKGVRGLTGSVGNDGVIGNKVNDEITQWVWFSLKSWARGVFYELFC